MGKVSVSRYRCNGCGNLTRFDVTTLRRTRSFHHYTVGGELEIEDVDVLDESTENVACRWCGHGRDVVEIKDGDDEMAVGESDAASLTNVGQSRPPSRA